MSNTTFVSFRGIAGGHEDHANYPVRPAQEDLSIQVGKLVYYR